MIKKRNIIFWIKILIPYFIIIVFSYFINTADFYAFLSKNIPDIKLFGGFIYNIVKEIILLSLILIILLIIKIRKENAEIKKERFIKSFIKGWPIFVCLLPEFVFILYEVIFVSNDYSHYGIIGLLCYCIIIGLTEELIFRKWILNELVDEFKAKKNVILPIIISSILFGLIHLVNFFLGQSLLDTSIQIIQNIFWAMVIGAIYYKTKNIWSVILIHAIEDFILKLDSVIPLPNYMFNYNSQLIQILKIGVIILSIIIYLVYFIKLMHNKEKNNRALILLLISYVSLETLFIVLHIK